MKIDKSTIEMMEKCGCENCKDRSICNIGVDLVNCYASKTLAIHQSSNAEDLICVKEENQK